MGEKYETIPNVNGSPNPTFAAMLEDLQEDHPVRKIHGLGHKDDLISDGSQFEKLPTGEIPYTPIEPTDISHPGEAKHNWPCPNAKPKTTIEMGTHLVTDL